MTIEQATLNRRRFIGLAGATAAIMTLGPAHSAAAKSLRIGIIGSGKVGSALGRTWVSKGHEVMFSSRNLDHDKALAAELGRGARAGTPKEAANFGEAILIAVPYGALPELGKSLKDDLEGKVVIDACNPFPSRDGDIATWAREIGAGVATAELLPGTRLVRAFNAIGAASMGAAHEKPGVVGMPMVGHDKKAVRLAYRLIRDVGYEPVLIGGLKMGRHLMPGTPLAGEHSPDEIEQIANKLKNE